MLVVVKQREVSASAGGMVKQPAGGKKTGKRKDNGGHLSFHLPISKWFIVPNTLLPLSSLPFFPQCLSAASQYPPADILAHHLATTKISNGPLQATTVAINFPASQSPLTWSLYTHRILNCTYCLTPEPASGALFQQCQVLVFALFFCICVLYIVVQRTCNIVSCFINQSHIWPI